VERPPALGGCDANDKAGDEAASRKVKILEKVDGKINVLVTTH
jgi:hypothetical protein